MSGIGFSELVLLFIIGLLILGPERLPRVATQLGRWVGRARRTANQLRYQLEREIALADIEKSAKDKKPPPNQRTGASGSGSQHSGNQEAASPSPAGADETNGRQSSTSAAGAVDASADAGAGASSTEQPSAGSVATDSASKKGGNRA
ncbi:MAG: Sec-independent protein translocase protein TatB [Gammaproteobacteria bacterium]|nr:Sec-independent protein translocase protein TatB [Gammaproteobacteria bacterium]